MKNIHKDLPWYHEVAALAEVTLEEAQKVILALSQTSQETLKKQ